MAVFRIGFQKSQLLEQLRAVKEKLSGADLTPLPATLAEIFARGVRQNLESGGAGLGWAALHPVTRKIRARLGYGSQPPLTRTGEMLRSIVSRAVDGKAGEVEVGVGWAAVLQLGGRLNNRDIPARPFLVPNEGAKKELRDAIGQGLFGVPT